MNGVQLNAEERRIAHARKVEHIDAVAIRAALAGTPTVLTAIEEGVVISICDIYCLDQAVVAQGLEMTVRTLQRRIHERREEIVSPHQLQVLTDEVREPVAALIDAVAGGDGATVAGILKGCDLAQLGALVVVLAKLAADSRCQDMAEA